MRTILVAALVPCALGQPPAIQSIQNAASSVSALAVPQMLVAIHGTNLSARTMAANGTPLPIHLGGASVTFNGIAAPLLYVSPDQINAQVPSGVENSTTASVVVQTDTDASAPYALVVEGGQPGIFTQDASGCGPAIAYNVHADGSLTMNTPATSLDPVNDLGLTLFLTGLGPFSDRLDGAPWQFNPADDRSAQYTPQLGISGLYNAITDLHSTYAGPAPGTVGVDQINALFYHDPYQDPSIEGCKIAMSITWPELAATQYVNVSVHSGGGKCVDGTPSSLGMVTWSKSVTIDASGASSQASVGAQFLQAPGLGTVKSFFSGSSGESMVPVYPSYCAASYPATLSAGALTISGTGLTPVTVNPNNQNGVLSYQAALDPASIVGGTYSISGRGAPPQVGAFNATTNIPAPITVTTNLSPGTVISIPFTVNWTGGDATSSVNVSLLTHDPSQLAVGTLFADALASTGTATLAYFPSIFGFARPATSSASPPVELELIVTQTSLVSPSQTFTAPGLTLGGEQTWLYVFDFKGLKQ